MPVLSCYLYNMSIDNVEDIRCSNKEKCEGCIFVVRTQEDGPNGSKQVGKEGTNEVSKSVKMEQINCLEGLGCHIG